MKANEPNERIFAVILSAVCKETGLTWQHLFFQKTRRAKIIHGKDLAIYFLYKFGFKQRILADLFGLSRININKRINNLHNIQAFYPKLREKLTRLFQLIQSEINGAN